MFESYGVPALFICKSPVLASFANGRPTSLVIETGFHYTTVTPVHDGYAIQKCVEKFPIGGAMIHRQLKNWLTTTKG